MLTNELILANRELQKIKAENKQIGDSLKKSEKENYEYKKSVGSKDTALEKLRKENDELWSVVNTDKYKSIRAIETEKEKAVNHKIVLQERLDTLQKDYDALKTDSESLKEKDSSLSFESQRLRDRDATRETIIKTLEERVRNHESYAAKSEQLLSEYKQEADNLRPENEQLKKDMTWLAN